MGGLKELHFGGIVARDSYGEGNQSGRPGVSSAMESFATFRRVLASLGLLVMVLTACQPVVGDPGAYEIVGLIAD